MHIVRRHLAMATRFEAILAGEDLEHLDAVAWALFDEVDRVERLLSRFDPVSETARINREAANGPVKVSVEMADVLDFCRAGETWTGGRFTIVGSSASRKFAPQRLSWDAVDFDPVARTIAFCHPHAQLDFGGFGKGYALDRCAEILKRFGVCSALVHGGTSSAIACGVSPQGEPWEVTFGPLKYTFPLLSGEAFSTSAVEDQEEAEIIDPRSSKPLAGSHCCAVWCESAAHAEIASTALLIAGDEREGLVSASPAPLVRVVAFDHRGIHAWHDGVHCALA